MSFLVTMIGMLTACGPALRAPEAMLLSPQSQLNPGDVLRITVWRQPEFSGDFVITADSTLVHPLYHTVRVAGVSLPVARERLRTFLTGFEQNPQFVVELLFAVAVGGEVRRPDLYQRARGTTVAQAIAQAGGPTERGRLDRVRVVRGEREMVIDLMDAGSPSATLPIRSGDQIFVLRRSTFNFVGDVFTPILSLTSVVLSILTLSRLQ